MTLRLEQSENPRLEARVSKGGLIAPVRTTRFTGGTDSWLFDSLRHHLHDLLVESIQGIPDGLEEVRGAAGVVPVPGGH